MLILDFLKHLHAETVASFDNQWLQNISKSNGCWQCKDLFL